MKKYIEIRVNELKRRALLERFREEDIKWESWKDEYGPIFHAPTLDESEDDDNHATGHIEEPCMDYECMICKKPGRCITFNDHRDCDTDDEDWAVCLPCIKKSVEIFEDYNERTP